MRGAAGNRASAGMVCRIRHDFPDSGGVWPAVLTTGGLARSLPYRPGVKETFLVSAVLCLGGCMVPEAAPTLIGVQSDPRADGGLEAGGDAASTDGRPPGLDLLPAAERPSVDVDPTGNTWTEHWFEHTQVVKLDNRDGHAAVYVDDDVDRAGARWVFPFASTLWNYTKATYGVPGDPVLYLVLHEARFSGGHASSIFGPSHDYRNVIDYGGGAAGYWAQMSYPEGIASLAGLILESNSLGVERAPAAALSRTEFQRIYSYDALKAIGSTAAADRVLASAMTATAAFPRADSYWFRDWYYPLWKADGAAVFARYFQLLWKQFPKQPREDGRGFRYAREMNWGEYVHFMSGAAGRDLKASATAAFGWPAEQDLQLSRARLEFPGITYPVAPPVINSPVANKPPASATP